jgi:hypothetical protein
LLIVGCRQPNPEWKGPNVSTTSDEDSTSSVDSEAADSSDGFMTEGQSCNNDNMCPDGWACGPEGCQQAMEGDACNPAGNCQAPFDICGPEETCQDGSEGDACTMPNHCAGGLMCTDGVCG